MTFDDEKLPPTQYLLYGVLVARYRTGEPYWTFHSKALPAAQALAAAGLVTYWVDSGNRVGLRPTDRLIRELGDYQTPRDKEIDKLKARIAFLEELHLDALAERLAPLLEQRAAAAAAKNDKEE